MKFNRNEKEKTTHFQSRKACYASLYDDYTPVIVHLSLSDSYIWVDLPEASFVI